MKHGTSWSAVAAAFVALLLVTSWTTGASGENGVGHSFAGTDPHHRGAQGETGASSAGEDSIQNDIAERKPDSIPHRRISDRKKGEGPGTQLARLPLRIATLPLWVVDRTLYGSLYFVESHHLVPKAQGAAWTLAELGIFPRLGKMGEGASFGGGVAYEFYRGSVTSTIDVGASVSAYQDYRLRLNFAGVTGERVGLVTEVRYQSRPEEDFFGIGPGSAEEDRSNYHLEKTGASIRFKIGPVKKMHVQSRLEYSNNNIFSGGDNALPSTDERFASAEAPGLRGGAEYVSGGLSLVYDTRNHPGDATSGALAEVALASFEQINGDGLNYMHYAFKLQGYVPLLGRDDPFGPRSHVAVRLVGEFTDPRGGDQVPFFRMPRVGGSRTVRGFRTSRFADRNSVVANVEYRYQIQNLLQWALFWDEGQVFLSSRDFDFGDFRSSYGAGVRVIFGHNVFFRLEVAHGAEGARVISKFSLMY